MDLSWTFLRNIHVLKVKKNPRGLFMSTKSIFHPWRLTYLINFILFALFLRVFFQCFVEVEKMCFYYYYSWNFWGVWKIVVIVVEISFLWSELGGWFLLEPYNVKIWCYSYNYFGKRRKNIKFVLISEVMYTGVSTEMGTSHSNL